MRNILNGSNPKEISSTASAPKCTLTETPPGWSAVLRGSKREPKALSDADHDY